MGRPELHLQLHSLCQRLRPPISGIKGSLLLLRELQPVQFPRREKARITIGLDGALLLRGASCISGTWNTPTTDNNQFQSRGLQSCFMLARGHIAMISNNLVHCYMEVKEGIFYCSSFKEGCLKRVPREQSALGDRISSSYVPYVVCLFCSETQLSAPYGL